MTPGRSTEPLALHPLTFLEDGGEVVVGRSDIHSYGVFPPDGAALVRELAAGRGPADAADWYAATYGETVDMDGLLATLGELGLLRGDGEPAAAAPARVRWQRLGSALFSPVARVLYAALAVAAIVAGAVDPRVVPHAGNVFFAHSLVVVAATVFAGQLALCGVHELFHVLAGRRLGVDSRVRISRRLYFIVFETNLDGLAVVPRRRRYLPILAGLLADALAVCALTLLGAVTSGVLAGVCLALAFTTLPRMAWQLYLFLRTDVYVLIATATGALDLDTVARGLLANRVNRRLGRPLRDERRWHPRDRRLARWYAPVLVAGYAWMAAVLALVLAPLLLRFWQSPVLLALTLSQLAVVLALRLREGRTA